MFDPTIIIDAILLVASLGMAIFTAIKVVRMQRDPAIRNDPTQINSTVRLLTLSVLLLCITTAWLLLEP